MVQYLDHVEIHSSSAISCTRNNSSSTQKSHDVEMNCDEVEESANKTYPGNHYLNQPVRCLNLCGHLQ